MKEKTTKIKSSFLEKTKNDMLSLRMIKNKELYIRNKNKDHH